MKKKLTASLKKTHWTTRFVIKYGTIASLLTLLTGFFAGQGSHTAISLCETAVYLFSISMVGGILLDVIAARKGMRD
ncbi:MAG: hypothetical protein E7414_01940 [Ruminococcaceae bacterium]|nr:hypothetical protein [Oscillospiraceae bacterium]